MKDVHIAVGVAAIAFNGVAAAFGAWCWWRYLATAWFWRLVRAAQAVVVLQAALGGLLVLAGHKPKGLHVLYGVLPLLVAVIAEQLRIASAQMVLDAGGYESAQAVGKLAPEEQQAVVESILRREMGVMVLAAVVVVVLLSRAAATAG